VPSADILYSVMTPAKSPPKAPDINDAESVPSRETSKLREAASDRHAALTKNSHPFCQLKWLWRLIDQLQDLA
jgi:hypothetical protein